MIFVIPFLMVLLTAVTFAVVKSLDVGAQIFQQTRPLNTANRFARRVLALNLLEPGLTVPNAIIVMVLSKNIPFVLSRSEINPWFQVFLMFWPMLVIFIAIPIILQGDPDLNIRRMANESAFIGIMRLFTTVIAMATSGIGTIIGIPLLLWSMKRIKRLNGQLGGDYEEYLRTLENSNVRVLLGPTEQ